MQRGVIRNRENALQIRDFSGLQFGTITPTDIDMYIEYHDKLFILAEAKYKNTILPDGQNLAILRLVKDHKKPTIYFIVEHDTEIPGDIDFANTTVRLWYTNMNGWGMPDNGKSITLREAADMFIKKYGGNDNG